MPNYSTSITYNGDGSTTDFTIPFTYTDTSEVTVTFKTTTLSVSFVGTNILRTASPMAVGNSITIRRVTDVTSPDVVFSSGVQPNGSAINTLAKQIFQSLQEANDPINSAFDAASKATTALANFQKVFVSALDFGAKGDGVTDDTLAIQQAAWYLQGKSGGVVYLPPTGSFYKIDGTVYLPNGVTLMGAPCKNFPGHTAPKANWALYGTWINPTHSTNSAIVLLGHGSGVVGLNFYHDQPDPAPGWTPNVYGYGIEQRVSFSTISDIVMVNAYNGVWMNYTTASGGGSDVHWSNLSIAAFHIAIRTTCVNDTIYWKNIHLKPIWQATNNAYVMNYMFNNAVGWYCGYTDNCLIDGFETFLQAYGIYFVNETCQGVTHSFWNANMSNVCLVSKVAAKTAASDTAVSGSWSNVIAMTGNLFGSFVWSDTMFQFISDQTDLQMSNLRVSSAGGTVMEIGSGTGGKVGITNLQVLTYSSVGSGLPAFLTNSGSSLRLANYDIHKNVGNGSRFSGASSDNVITGQRQSIMFFGRFSESSATGTGAYVDLTTDCKLTPSLSGISQVRLMADIFVSTPKPASTVTAKLTGGVTCVTNTLASTSSGWLNLDSGWLDISDAELALNRIIGRFSLYLDTGVIVSNGAVQVLTR